MNYSEKQFADLSRQWSILYHIHSSKLMQKIGFENLIFSLDHDMKVNGAHYWIRERANAPRPSISIERLRETPAGLSLDAYSGRHDYRLTVSCPETDPTFEDGPSWMESQDRLDIIWEQLRLGLAGARIPFYDFRTASYADDLLTAAHLERFDFVLNYAGTSRAGELNEQDKNTINMRFFAEV